MAGCCHGVDCYRSLLALEFVDSPNSCAGEPLLDFENLRVVRGYDENVVVGDRTFNAVAVNPSRAAVQDISDDPSYCDSFLDGGAFVPAVLDRDISKTGSADRTVGIDLLTAASINRMELSFVEEFGIEGADVWVHSPRFTEEKALFGCNRLMPGKDMFQR